ncbi:hypothetical protein Q0Z83_043470 [Actinoplanes sichuanensis]|uniref:FtsX-like permease family protein n=1 Tax=Actinoplanes sichuanensis TaxID=512349 RepID=A0ABW4AU88_9ACTN|nr:hypothetical protein [Actinoplanes sichuanensis]BEL06156.1 hypothetical protein Q0Z83_043470 [Actinoplanes sichuanensis]
MLHKGIKFAYAVLLTVSAALAFIVVHHFDETTVAGTSYVVSFQRTDDGAPGPRVADMLDDLTRAHGVNVGRLYQHPRDERIRRVHLVVGDPEAQSSRWLAQGYPDFSRGAPVEMRPYREIVNIHPDGLYYVYGPEPAAVALAREFARLGYHGQVEPAFSPAGVVAYYGNGTLLWAFLVVGFVVILVVACAVTLNAKSYGIQRLHGQSYARILFRDLRQLAGFAAVAAVGTCSVTVTLLYLYNDLNQIGTYASVALSFAGVYVLAALLAHVVTLALVHDDEIVNAVKGEVTAAWASAGTYVLRIAAVALIFSVTTATIAAGFAVQEQRNRSRVWAAMGDAYHLRISSVIDDGQRGAAIDDRIGRWIRDADTRDEVVLAWLNRPGSRLAGTTGPDVLVVNDAYLLDHEIRTAADTPVRPAGDDHLRILSPQRYASDAARITAQVTTWATAQAARSGRGDLPGVRLEQLRDHQSVPVFVGSAGEGGPVLDDPVIVVVSGASGVIPDDEYTSAASRGEILVKDADRTMASLAAAGLDTYVPGVSAFAQEAADRYRDLRNQFGLQVFSLVAAVVVYLVTAAASSIVYCRRRAQTLYVKYLCGWSFLRTHGGILVFEGLLAVGMAVWSQHGTATAIARSTAPGAPPAPPGLLPLQGVEPLLAAGIAMPALALTVLVLVRINATFVRTHSASLS